MEGGGVWPVERPAVEPSGAVGRASGAMERASGAVERDSGAVVMGSCGVGSGADKIGTELPGTKFVGDITIGYDPPRRGRVIPMAVHQYKAHEDVEDGGS